MDSLNDLNLLKQTVVTKNLKEALTIIETVETCVHQNITSAEASFALQKLFDDKTGTLAFLDAIALDMSRNAKTFEKCVTQLLTLYSQWIQDFSMGIKEYAKKLLDMTSRYMSSSYTSAKVKQLSTSVLYAIVQVRSLPEDEINNVLIRLLKSYDPRRTQVYYGRELLKTMGLISRYHPKEVEKYHVMVRRAIRETIEVRLIEKSYPTFQLLSAALQALSDYLYNFPPRLDLDTEVDLGRTYYKYVKMFSMLSPGDGKDASRKALQLFSVHYQHFHDQIFQELRFWQTILKDWVAAQAYEDKKTGIYATHAFHMSLAITLDARDSPDDEPLLRNLVQTFRHTLQSPNADFNAIRIAIRGFGTLSKACSARLDKEFLNNVLTLVLQRIRYTDYKDDAQKSKKLLEHLPDYVNSLSEIMTNMKGLNAIQLTYLENIVVELMRDFYYLSTVHHELVIVSLLTTLSNIQKWDENAFTDFLDKIVLQGVVWACDKCLIYDQDWSEDRDWKENVTFWSYIPLWQGLVTNEKQHPNFDRPKIAKKVLEKLLATLFQIIEKLNFATTKRTYKDEEGHDQEFNFCDPNIDLVPVKPQDFHIFVNLVDFYVEILNTLPLTAKQETVTHWLGHACDELIHNIVKYPLISGFVKLLEVMVKIGKDTKYFQEFENPNMSPGIRHLRSVLAAFVAQVIQRIKTSTSELQLSYLKLIFVYPVSLLCEHGSQMGEIYVIAFEFGKNLPVLWIASMALRSLEELIEEIDENKRRQVLRIVLPVLESFMSSSGDATLLKTEIVKPKRGKRTNVRRKFMTANEAETELIKFQKRIVLFMGKLSLEECQFMLERDPSSLELVKWEPVNHLDFKIQSNVFQIDHLIPRVTHLALNSSDRKTKIAACELLHTIILFLIGTHKLSTVIWSKLSPKIIELGCDSDVAVQEMYEPLLYQIVHYLSKPDNINLEGTQTFIESLLHLVSHSSNNSIQDLSAKLLREFVSWSIRHIPRERQGSTPANLKTLFNRLKLYCTDSDPNKRKAALLAFNNLYRITRNEQGLVSEMWLELFYCYCVNYLMSENFYIDTQQEPELEQNNIVLDNFMKVFVVKKEIFDAKDPNRKFPVAFGETDEGLKSLALWLLGQCGTVTQRNYRMKCLEMFSLLAKRLTPNNSVSEFVTQERIEIVKIFEDGNRQGLTHFPTCDTLLFSNRNVNSLQLWFSIILTALDGYHWIISKSLTEPKAVINQSQKVFLPAVEHFIQNMTFVDVSHIITSDVNRTSGESTDSVEVQLHIYEKERMKMLKQNILAKIIEFFKDLMSRQHVIPSTFFHNNLEKLLDIVQFMIFEPSKLEFPLHETKEVEKGRILAVEFLVEVGQKLPADDRDNIFNRYYKSLLSTLKELLASFDDDIKETNIDYDHHSKAKGVYLCLKNLSIADATVENEIKTCQTEFFSKIFMSLKKTEFSGTEMEVIHISNPNPSVKEYVSRLLKIVLHSNASLPQLHSYIFESTLLVTDVNVVKHGEYFVMTYKNVIMEFICRNVRDFIQQMFTSNASLTFDHNLKFLSDLCEFSHKKIAPVYAKHIKTELVETIMSRLPEILNTARTVEDNEIHVINLLSHVMMIHDAPLYTLDTNQLIQNWFIEVMSKKATVLDVKTKLLVLLPCFTGPESTADGQNTLYTCLTEHLQDKHFPFQSHDLKQGSIKSDTYIACFQAVLEALVATRSPVMLKFLWEVSAADPKHVIEHEFRTAIDNYARRQEETVLLGDQETLFGIFCQRKYTHEIRLTVLKRFLLGLLKASPESVVKLFFQKTFNDVLKLVSSDNQSDKHSLINKIGGYQLLELLFGVCTKEYLESPESPLHDPDGKTRASTPVIYACRDEFKNSIINPDPITAEYFRKSQCTAFNCLCTVLANHQTNAELYYKLLFKDYQTWSNIVQAASDVYQMNSQEVEDYPVVRRRIVAIRDISKVIGVKENRHFHMTTSIYGSSLSQDVLKLDFSNTVVRTSVPQEMTLAPAFGEIALEKIMINDHECMANICAVIHHLYEKKISNFNFSVPWIKSLCDMMTEHPVINVRRFIAKIIDNCRDVFKYAAATIYPAVLKFLVEESKNSYMNAFITDLCVLLLEWSETYTLQTQDEHVHASKLVEFLIQKSQSERRDILKANMEILKNFIELWKNFLTLPYKTILDKFSANPLSTTKGNTYGIHVCAIILSSGLIPWSNETKTGLFQGVKEAMYEKLAVVYQPAAQLYGMFLKEEFKDKTDSEFLENPVIIEFITQLKRDLLQDKNNALDIIYGIQKYCVIFLKPFTNLITDKISSAIRKIKLKYLEMFLSAIEFYENHVYREIIRTVDIRNLLKNPEYKIIGLHIVNRALSMITPTEALFLYTEIVALINDASSEVRDIVYEILIYFYKNMKGQIDLNMISKIGALLLEGVLDADPDIQARLIEFWSDPEQLPVSLEKRFERLLCNIYIPESKNFLTTATILLLHPAIVDPSSKLPLFHYTPPQDAKHVERKIDTNWRRNASLTKLSLFVETKTLRETIQTLSTQIDGIRATQVTDDDDEPFTPTVDPNTFFTPRNAFKSNIVTQDSFFIATQPKILNRRSNLTETQEIPTQTSGYSHLRKRFLKDSDKIQRENAMKAIRYRTNNEQKQRSAQQERELGVKLYRRYRDGDFPDLNINPLAILLPLLGLLRYDKQITRQVFIELFGVSVRIGNSRDIPIHTEIIGNRTSTILNTFVSGDSTFIATLLNIAIQNAKLFQINPQSVKNVAKATNNVTLGILYLEERLTIESNEDHASTSNKSNTSWGSRATNNMTPEDHWVQLAELYGCLSEHDVLNGIFVNKIEVHENLPKAIDFMAENRYDKADDIWVGILEAMIEQNPEQDFCFQGHLECLTILGDWDGLEQNTRQQFSTIDEVWDNGFNQEIILPHLLTSETRLILEETHRDNMITEALTRWKESPDYWDHLKTNFSEELTMLLMAQGDYRHSRLISEQSIRHFLLEWANLNVLCDKLRLAKLEKMRISSELFTTIGKFFLSTSHTDKEVFEKTVKMYERSLPSKSDSTLFWDTLITYRTFFCQKLIEQTIDEELEGVKANLTRSVKTQQTHLFNVGLTQNNVGFARNILDRMRTEQPLLKSSLLIKTVNDKTDIIERLDQLELARVSLVKINDERVVTEEQTLERIQVLLSLAEIGEIIVSVSESNKSHQIFKEYTGLTSFSTKNIQEKVFSYLKSAMEFSEDEPQHLANCYMKYADFARCCLDTVYLDDKVSLQIDIIRYTLRAMRLGHIRAREIFPSLLQLPNLHADSCSAAFIAEAVPVPDWLFLDWIPQILCHLNLHVECCLDIIVTKLFQAYPSALIYPMRFLLKGTENDQHVRGFVRDMMNKLETPLMKRFIDELSLICHPMMKLRQAIINLRTLMDSHSQLNVFRDVVMKEMENLFGNERNQGSEYKRIQKYENHFKKLLKLDVNNSRDEIMKILTDILKVIGKVSSTTSFSTESLSPWLANYQYTSGTDSISIPGQFNKMRSKPHTSQHVKIVKVDADLTVLISLRRPIKIKFHGTDGREYSFLAKYGEDLRQDQRVQQLLGIMSDKMECDQKCRVQKLKIVTYNVTPISNVFGLMNWVPNTIQMKDAISKSFERHEKKSFNDQIKVAQVHDNKFIPKENPAKTAMMYATAAKNDRNTIAAHHQSLVSMFRPDILKKSILDYASDFEKYYVLKYNFARSLAAMAVSHWILGIGDRHMGNTLIDTKSFTLIGIDFGHAFGTATRDLQVPELIPFRLTPQMQFVLEPIGITGLVERCMTHIMRCFRNESQVLKSCMDLFVRDPTFDWLNASNAVGDQSWAPETRVNIAYRKLKGVNPAKITQEELSLNRISAHGLAKGYQNILRTAEYNGNEENLSVEIQVRKLILQATDEAILGITYFPWLPFL